MMKWRQWLGARYWIGAVVVLLAAWLSVGAEAKPAATTTQAATQSAAPLSARIVVDRNSAALELTNVSDAPVGVCTETQNWRSNSGPAYFSTDFRPDAWKSNKPTLEKLRPYVVQIAPGKSVQFSIDQTSAAMKPGANFKVSGSYGCEAEYAKGLGIWAGWVSAPEVVVSIAADGTPSTRPADATTAPATEKAAATDSSVKAIVKALEARASFEQQRGRRVQITGVAGKDREGPYVQSDKLTIHVQLKDGWGEKEGPRVTVEGKVSVIEYSKFSSVDYGNGMVGPGTDYWFLSDVQVLEPETKPSAK